LASIGFSESKIFCAGKRLLKTHVVFFMSVTVLKSVECEKQYSGQFVVIYNTCQTLFPKNQTEVPDIKKSSFLDNYFKQIELFDLKTISTFKNYESF
jgi:hypothetical protein